jgi:hypothetical protein
MSAMGIHMFEGIDFSLFIVFLEVLIATYCFILVHSITKNIRLAGFCLAFVLIMGTLNTIVTLKYPYYWVLVITATIGCVAYGLKRNPDARKNVIKKLLDVERTLYLIPLVLIVIMGSYALLTYKPIPKTTVIAPIGDVSIEIPSDWANRSNSGNNQGSWQYYGFHTHGSVTLEIIEPSSISTPDTLSNALENEINQLYSGKLFGGDGYSLISKIEKNEISFRGDSTFAYSYYFTESGQTEKDSNYVDYAREIFFVYHNRLYRFTFSAWGSRYALLVPTVKQEVTKLSDRFLSTARFE